MEMVQSNGFTATRGKSLKKSRTSFTKNQKNQKNQRENQENQKNHRENQTIKKNQRKIKNRGKIKKKSEEKSKKSKNQGKNQRKSHKKIKIGGLFGPFSGDPNHVQKWDILTTVRSIPLFPPSLNPCFRFICLRLDPLHPDTSTLAHLSVACPPLNPAGAC